MYPSINASSCVQHLLGILPPSYPSTHASSHPTIYSSSCILSVIHSPTTTLVSISYPFPTIPASDGDECDRFGSSREVEAEVLSLWDLEKVKQTQKSVLSQL